MTEYPGSTDPKTKVCNDAESFISRIVKGYRSPNIEFVQSVNTDPMEGSDEFHEMHGRRYYSYQVSNQGRESQPTAAYYPTNNTVSIAMGHRNTQKITTLSNAFEQIGNDPELINQTLPFYFDLFHELIHSQQNNKIPFPLLEIQAYAKINEIIDRNNWTLGTQPFDDFCERYDKMCKGLGKDKVESFFFSKGKELDEEFLQRVLSFFDKEWFDKTSSRSGIKWLFE